MLPMWSVRWEDHREYAGIEQSRLLTQRRRVSHMGGPQLNGQMGD